MVEAHCHTQANADWENGGWQFELNFGPPPHITVQPSLLEFGDVPLHTTVDMLIDRKDDGHGGFNVSAAWYEKEGAWHEVKYHLLKDRGKWRAE